ncbi:MAG: sigma factor-like helix-turn-helix DNA-binding protein [Planctomycetota bacterium]
MPALAEIKHPSLRALAEDLRFGSKAALRRQIETIESMAGELDADERYPVDWIVFRVSGYRPESPELGEPVAGDALLTDLSALCETLCENAGLTTNDLPEGSMPAPALCERWGVSRRSIDRYRRLGLIARRLASAGRRQALAFTPAAIAAFERTHADMLARASGASQMPGADRSRALERARELRNEGLTRLKAAERLASELGRSREAMRTLLEKHDLELEADGAPPLFAPVRRVNGRARGLCLRLARRGAGWAEIAATLRADLDITLSSSAVRRLVNERRAEILRRLDLTTPHSPAFERADAADTLLSPEIVRNGTVAVPPADLREQLETGRAVRPLAAGDESALALAHQFLRWRAAGAVLRLARPTASAVAIDHAETDLRWAGLLRVRLLASQLGAIVAALEGAGPGPLLGRAGPEARAQLAEALRVSGHAVDRFAPLRGGRLGASVSLALGRAKLGAHTASDPGTGRAGRRMAAGLAPVELDRLRPSPRWHAWITPPPWCDTPSLSALEDRDREILVARFGLDGAAPLTLDALADRLGVPRMHAGRAERRALARLWNAATRP